MFRRKSKPSLLSRNKGRFAVGRVGDNFSCWDTYRDAVEYGYNKYGLDRFVVCPILDIAIPQIITRNIDYIIINKFI